MKNHRPKLKNIKLIWARTYFSALVRGILFYQWVGSLNPAQLVVPAVILIVINMAVTIGVYRSIFHFFLVTLSIIALVTLPSLFKTKNAHWLGAQEHQRFSDLFVFSLLQFTLSLQSYIITRNNPEDLLPLLFVSYLFSLIWLFVFKSYVWLRWSKSKA